VSPVADPPGQRIASKSLAGVVRRLLSVARRHTPALVVLEATGGFEMPVAVALAAAQVPLVIANPRHTRDFAQSTGQLSKTDAFDAQ